MSARLDDIGEHAGEHRARRTVADAGDFDGGVFFQHRAHGAGMLAFNFFGFVDRSAEADGKVVGEMVAADGDGGGVARDSSGEGDQFGGAAANVEEAGAEFAFVLGQASFGGSERLEDGVVDADAGTIHGGDNILSGGAGGSDDVHVGFEALADHANRVADIVLRVEKKFLGQNVEDFAIFGKLHAAGGFDSATNIVTLNVTRASADGDAAAAIDAADVDAGHADKGGFDGHANDGFGFFDGAANRTDREVEIHDLAFAPAFRFGRAERGEAHAAEFVELADQRAGFGAADVERYNMPFFLRQIRHSLVPFPFRCYFRFANSNS